MKSFGCESGGYTCCSTAAVVQYHKGINRDY